MHTCWVARKLVPGLCHTGDNDLRQRKIFFQARTLRLRLLLEYLKKTTHRKRTIGNRRVQPHLGLLVNVGGQLLGVFHACNDGVCSQLRGTRDALLLQKVYGLFDALQVRLAGLFVVLQILLVKLLLMVDLRLKLRRRAVIELSGLNQKAINLQETDAANSKGELRLAQNLTADELKSCLGAPSTRQRKTGHHQVNTCQESTLCHQLLTHGIQRGRGSPWSPASGARSRSDPAAWRPGAS